MITLYCPKWLLETLHCIYSDQCCCMKYKNMTVVCFKGPKMSSKWCLYVIVLYFSFINRSKIQLPPVVVIFFSLAASSAGKNPYCSNFWGVIECWMSLRWL